MHHQCKTDAGALLDVSIVLRTVHVLHVIVSTPRVYLCTFKYGTAVRRFLILILFCFFFLGKNTHRYLLTTKYRYLGTWQVHVHVVPCGKFSIIL